MLLQSSDHLKPVKVREFLFGYQDNAFSLLGGLQTIVHGDTKLPKKFGVLLKVRFVKFRILEK